MTLLSIDPGKRIGYALFTDKGEEIERGVIDFDTWFSAESPVEFGDYGLLHCNDWTVSQLVVEGFRHDPTVQQGGSLHEASQIVGSVKTLALIAEVPIAVQYASILPVAMLHDGYEPPKTRTGKKKHLPDQDSAWLHGRYYLRSIGVLD